MAYREYIENFMKEQDKDLQDFAFMIDLSQGGQMWIRINYGLSESTLKLVYIIEELHVSKSGISLIDEKNFEDRSSLVDYLVSQKVDPNYCRAVH